MDCSVLAGQRCAETLEPFGQVAERFIPIRQFLNVLNAEVTSLSLFLSLVLNAEGTSLSLSLFLSFSTLSLRAFLSLSFSRSQR